MKVTGTNPKDQRLSLFTLAFCFICIDQLVNLYRRFLSLQCRSACSEIWPLSSSNSPSELCNLCLIHGNKQAESLWFRIFDTARFICIPIIIDFLYFSTPRYMSRPDQDQSSIECILSRAKLLTRTKVYYILSTYRFPIWLIWPSQSVIFRHYTSSLWG